MLDTFLMGKLLHQDHKVECPYETKVELARQETRRLKRLLSALRYLWRNGFLVGSTFKFDHTLDHAPKAISK